MRYPHSCLVAVLATLVCFPHASACGDDAFAQRVMPLVQRHCIDCHNEGDDNGSVNFASYLTLESVIRDVQLWEKIAAVVARREMPPRSSEPLSDGDRQAFIDFVERVVQRVNREGQNDVAPINPRRLTRREYANTIRDLLGVEIDAQTFLPEDKVGATGFRNDSNELMVSPELLERCWMLADKVVAEAIERDASANTPRLLIVRPDESLSSEAAARRIIESFGKRAFRRPLAKKEVDQYLRLFSKLEQADGSFEFGVAAIAKAMLVSPTFLFRIESVRAAEGVAAINDFDLASRLSYLLWSSCPDDELLGLAEKRRLNQTDVLVPQIQRMLADDRAQSLADEFVDQWLFSRVTRREPDPVVYPTYTKELDEAARQELRLFVSNLFKENRSLVDLIDADYTYVNQPLAEHYGMEGVADNGWQRVALTSDHRRGGLLGMASVLQRTSMSDRTSPTVRGAWVLDAILGTPPPPPPPDVNNTLDQDNGGEQRALTFREKLELHANDGTTCASCHKKMDPIGYSMDNYDGIGRWRLDSYGVPLNTSGIMTDGRELSGIEDLKSVLLERKTQFIRNVAAQFLTYALGREIARDDFASLNAITKHVVESDYQALSLVVAVVQSYPFTHKKHPAAAVASQ